ncbi:MAG: M23 family metallopeptidase, partial [Chloroflexi bacterium]|nr:M23 family metallopeptidase [Chloroflexota bacterium]
MLWFIFSTRASADFIRLRPPFSGTVRLTAFFDHQTPRCYWIGQPPCDGYVWIYTGERVLDYSPHPYDGHEGIDWALPDGTPVYAAASGVVAAFGSVGVGYGNRVVIDHQNGYFTLYAHLLGFNNLWVGKSVVAGDLIGSSDHDGCAPCGPHLHFGLYHHDWTAGHETDPFGWQGSVTDPLIDYNGETAICSWRSADEDPVSCADTIIEDAGRGSDIQGSGWLASSIGNGYHMYYHSNVNDYNVYASWWATSTIEGSYKVYVYIPSQNATITNADYLVWNGIDYYPDVYVGSVPLMRHRAFKQNSMQDSLTDSESRSRADGLANVSLSESAMSLL